MLLASPRHRAFYFGLPGEATAVVPSPRALPRPAPAGGAGPAPIAKAGARVIALAVPTVHVPEPDDQGRVRVPVTDDASAHLPAAGTPLGWEVKEFAGDASVEVVRNDGRVAMRLRSERASFALYRDVVLDVRQYPVLTWWWRVLKLPPSGDVRDPARDDQAAQVYLIFPRWPSPITTSDVIGYVWDSRAPAGTTLRHPRAANVRIIVVESGAGRLDSWVRETRNVAEDYQALFGRQPPRVGKVALMTDSNDTKSAAEVLFSALTFSKNPVSMLR